MPKRRSVCPRVARHRERECVGRCNGDRERSVVLQRIGPVNRHAIACSQPMRCAGFKRRSRRYMRQRADRDFSEAGDFRPYRFVVTEYSFSPGVNPQPFVGLLKRGDVVRLYYRSRKDGGKAIEPLGITIRKPHVPGIAPDAHL